MLAFGLDVSGAGVAPHPAHVGRLSRVWHPHVLRQRRGDTPASTVVHASPEQISLDAADAFRVAVTRGPPMTTTVTAPQAVSAMALLHPVLSFGGAVAASWLGRAALHGVAVLIESRAWVLLAGQGGGKSTLAVALDQAGFPVLSDDLVVIDDGVVLAGPRVSDLRMESAAHPSFADLRLAEVDWRRRWRRELSEAPLEAALGGFIDLSWAAELSVDELGAQQRVVRLGVAEVVARSTSDAKIFLDLIDRPWFALERPRSFSQITAVVEAVTDIATGQAGA